MAIVVDSSVWVDFFRSKTPPARKRRIAPYLDRDDLLLVEPIGFELLRAAPKRERRRVRNYLATVSWLSSPADLWQAAAQLGQRCLDTGYLPSPMDLLIAQICIAHGVPLVTLDADFERIATCSALQVELLGRDS